MCSEQSLSSYSKLRALARAEPPASPVMEPGFAERKAVGLLNITFGFCFWFIVVDVLIAAVNYLGMELEKGVEFPVVLGAGHAAGAVALVALYLSPGWRRGLCELCKPFETAKGVLYLLVAVAAVRAAWIILVPTLPYSDGATYDTLARNLVEKGEYFSGSTRAFRPPGYPLLLAGTYSLFGHSLLAAKLVGVLLAAVTEWLCWVWVRRYVGPATAGVVVLLLVLWPSRTLHMDLLGYEDLATAVMMLSLVVMPDIRRRDGRWWRWVVAGVVLGLGILTRPTLAVTVCAVAVWMLMERRGARQVLASVGIYTATMLLALAPWTIRNYRVFGEFVPLTTNAGMVMYHSFSPDSRGSHHGPADADIMAAAGGGKVDELTYNRTAFQLTAKVVREDPLRAVYRMAVEKPAIYLGSDNAVAWLEGYLATWSDAPNFAKGLKAVALFLCNSYYIVLMLCPLLFARRVGRCMREYPAAAFALMIFLSGLVVHTIFEAQARYHMIYLPFWTICIGILLVRGRPADYALGSNNSRDARWSRLQGNRLRTTEPYRSNDVPSTVDSADRGPACGVDYSAAPGGAIPLGTNDRLSRRDRCRRCMVSPA